MSVEIFCCYARKDQPLLKELIAHLMPLQREGLITIWADIDINAGMEWEREIEKHLNTAQIILLLVSSDFMNSEYCYSKEMQKAKERHERGDAVVIPIILRHVDWQSVLGRFQALPERGLPVTSHEWHSTDKAFFNVAEGVRDVVTRLNSKSLANLTSRHLNSTEELVTEHLLEPNALPYPTTQPSSVRGIEGIGNMGIQADPPDSFQGIIELGQNEETHDLINFKRPILVTAAIDCIMLLLSFILVPFSIVPQIAIPGAVVIFIMSLIQTGLLEQWYWFIGVLLLSPAAGIVYILGDPMPLAAKWYWFIGLLVPSSLSGIAYGLYGPKEKPKRLVTHNILKQLILIISALGLILFLFAIIDSFITQIAAEWIGCLSIEFAITGYILTLIQLIRLKQKDWLYSVLIISVLFFPSALVIGIVYGLRGPTISNRE